MGSKKSASAPPRGGAREPGSYYWCSVRIVSIELPEQTQRRAYGCAPLALRRVIAKKKFSLGGWAPTRPQKHDQHVLTYDRPARITASTSAPPFLLHSIGTLYCTTPIQYIRPAGGEPAMSLSSTHLPRASHPPAFYYLIA